MYKSIILLASLTAVVGASSPAFTQTGPTPPALSAEVRHAGYSCPMHPEVRSEGPGKCPKCGMSLVLTDEEEATATQPQTPSAAREKIQQAQALLAEAKRELAQNGKYDCCIKDPCDRCALDHQSCPCADQVKAGKAVCPECYAGWQRGDGVIKGVKAAKVKMSSHMHKH